MTATTTARTSQLHSASHSDAAGVNAADPAGARSNITVVVRVRPLLAPEPSAAPTIDSTAARRLSSLPSSAATGTATGTGTGTTRVVHVLDPHVLVFDPKDPNTANAPRRYTHHSRRNKEVRYAFDRVLDEQSTQDDVFRCAALPLIDSVIDGFNATVFAYGATGCGKTHTITGSKKDPGLISRTVDALFARIQSIKDTRSVDASISYLEVYNETIRDLLVDSPASSTPLDLREDTNRVVVAGLSEHSLSSLSDLMTLLIKGNENRSKAPTEANAASSRSHAVLQIHLRHRDRMLGEMSVFKVSTLSIIDLAGSERASVTKNTGDRLLEGANINRSLLSLGNCINALCSDHPNHIPYRDSKLTRLLKFSLSGNCKVVMIANISPASMHYEETHNTLKYANRAKNIQTKVYQNTVEVVAHVAQYPKIIEALRAEIMLLRANSLGNPSGGIGGLVGYRDMSDGGSGGDVGDAVYVKKVAKVEKYAARYQEHMVEFWTIQHSMKRISTQTGLLGTLISALTRVSMEREMSGLIDLVKAMTSKVDGMYSASAAMWHNADRHRIASSNALEKLDKYRDCAELSYAPLLKERLCLFVESKLMDVRDAVVSVRMKLMDETDAASGGDGIGCSMDEIGRVCGDLVEMRLP
eukprot:jgi/Hompol1/1474/HPOL_000350-RA